MCALVAGQASADTLYLKNGTQIHGKVSTSPQGHYLLNVRGRNIIYRTNAVVKVERNAKTGEIDIEAAKERAKKRDAELTEQTGLDAALRAEMKTLLLEVQSGNETVASNARRRIFEIHANHDIIKFLKFRLIGSSPQFAVPILKILYDVKPLGLHDILIEHATHEAGPVRAIAISLLSRAKQDKDRDLVLRAMLDHVPSVRAAGARGMAEYNLPESTPVLIALLGDDREVWAAARFALLNIWKDVGDTESLNTQAQWAELWNKHKSSISEPLLSLDGLEPLIDPEMEFEDE